MGAKRSDFRLKKAWGRISLSLFVCLSLGVYIYIGLQPIRVEAQQNRLTIPSIELTTPVEDLERLGNTLIAPEVVAGAYQENPGKTLIIGHSSTVFKRLVEIEVGESLEYDGSLYRVSGRQILPKSEVQMDELVRADGKAGLVLMTCAGEHFSGDDYSHRLIIVAQSLE